MVHKGGLHAQDTEQIVSMCYSHSVSFGYPHSGLLNTSWTPGDGNNTSKDNVHHVVVPCELATWLPEI